MRAHRLRAARRPWRDCARTNAAGARLVRLRTGATTTSRARGRATVLAGQDERVRLHQNSCSPYPVPPLRVCGSGLLERGRCSGLHGDAPLARASSRSAYATASNHALTRAVPSSRIRSAGNGARGSWLSVVLGHQECQRSGDRFARRLGRGRVVHVEIGRGRGLPSEKRARIAPRPRARGCRWLPRFRRSTRTSTG